MDKIYVVYVVALNDEGTDRAYGTSVNGNKYKLGDRTWGWFPTFEEAEEAILNNHTDIFECLYNYACVEEVPCGILTINEIKQWYKAIFDTSKEPYPQVKKSDPPPWAQHFFNF